MRELRRRTGKTYQELGELSNYHRSTFCRAASGAELPGWEVVRMFVETCSEVLDEQADIDAWKALWQAVKASWCESPQ